MIIKRNFLLSFTIILLIITIEPSAANDDNECDCESKSSLRTKAGVKAATTGLLAAFGTSALGSSYVGFTAAGIAKYSLAALIQAKIGTFGLFSALQSIGATGGYALLGPYGLSAAAIVGAATYLYSSSQPAAEGCNCDSSDDVTEEELTQLYALKAIASCVEPGTWKEVVCGGRGGCELDTDDGELYCKCNPDFVGTYCEISKNASVPSDGEEPLPPPMRCKDEFVQNCTQCLIHKFTLNNPKNCYRQCEWKYRVPLSPANDSQRPDVSSLEMKRVPKMDVIEGTECSVQVNASCTTTIKYVYEHTDDYLDQLVVYYSSNEATCDNLFAPFGLDINWILGGIHLFAFLIWLIRKVVLTSTSFHSDSRTTEIRTGES